MPHCSQKKAEAIIEQRPYTGWKDLVCKTDFCIASLLSMLPLQTELENPDYQLF
jgi:hypothetical protein